MPDTKKIKAKKGRPQKYSDVEVMQQKIDEYFLNCPDIVIKSQYTTFNYWVIYADFKY